MIPITILAVVIAVACVVQTPKKIVGTRATFAVTVLKEHEAGTNYIIVCAKNRGAHNMHILFG
jgi:hypothetical protein